MKIRQFFFAAYLLFLLLGNNFSLEARIFSEDDQMFSDKEKKKGTAMLNQSQSVCRFFYISRSKNLCPCDGKSTIDCNGSKEAPFRSLACFLEFLGKWNLFDSSCRALSVEFLEPVSLVSKEDVEEINLSRGGNPEPGALTFRFEESPEDSVLLLKGTDDQLIRVDYPITIEPAFNIQFSDLDIILGFNDLSGSYDAEFELLRITKSRQIMFFDVFMMISNNQFLLKEFLLIKNEDESEAEIGFDHSKLEIKYPKFKVLNSVKSSKRQKLEIQSSAISSEYIFANESKAACLFELLSGSTLLSNSSINVEITSEPFLRINSFSELKIVASDFKFQRKIGKFASDTVVAFDLQGKNNNVEISETAIDLVVFCCLKLENVIIFNYGDGNQVQAYSIMFSHTEIEGVESSPVSVMITKLGSENYLYMEDLTIKGSLNPLSLVELNLFQWNSKNVVTIKKFSIQERRNILIVKGSLEENFIYLQEVVAERVFNGYFLPNPLFRIGFGDKLLMHDIKFIECQNYSFIHASDSSLVYMNSFSFAQSMNFSGTFLNAIRTEKIYLMNSQFQHFVPFIEDYNPGNPKSFLYLSCPSQFFLINVQYDNGLSFRKQLVEFGQEISCGAVSIFIDSVYIKLVQSSFSSDVFYLNTPSGSILQVYNSNFIMETSNIQVFFITNANDEGMLFFVLNSNFKNEQQTYSRMGLVKNFWGQGPSRFYMLSNSASHFESIADFQAGNGVLYLDQLNLLSLYNCLVLGGPFGLFAIITNLKSVDVLGAVLSPGDYGFTCFVFNCSFIFSPIEPNGMALIKLLGFSQNLLLSVFNITFVGTVYSTDSSCDIVLTDSGIEFDLMLKDQTLGWLLTVMGDFYEATSVELDDCKIKQGSKKFAVVHVESLEKDPGKISIAINNSSFENCIQLYSDIFEGQVEIIVSSSVLKSFLSENILMSMSSRLIKFYLLTSMIYTNKLSGNMFLITPNSDIQAENKNNYRFTINETEFFQHFTIIFFKYKTYGFELHLMNSKFHEIQASLTSLSIVESRIFFINSTFTIFSDSYRDYSFVEISNGNNNYTFEGNNISLVNKTSKIQYIGILITVIGSGHSVNFCLNKVHGLALNRFFHSRGCGVAAFFENNLLGLSVLKEGLISFETEEGLCPIGLTVKKSKLKISQSNMLGDLILLRGSFSLAMRLEELRIKISPGYKYALLSTEGSLQKTSWVRIYRSIFEIFDSKNSSSKLPLIQYVNEETVLHPSVLFSFKSFLKQFDVSKSVFIITQTKYNYLFLFSAFEELRITDSVFHATSFYLSKSINLISGTLIKIDFMKFFSLVQSRISVNSCEFTAIKGGTGTILNIFPLEEKYKTLKTYLSVDFKNNRIFSLESREKNPFIFIYPIDETSLKGLDFDVRLNYFKRVRSSLGLLKNEKGTNSEEAALSSVNRITDDPNNDIVNFRSSALVNSISMIPLKNLEEYIAYEQNEQGVPKNLTTNFSLLVRNNESSPEKCYILVVGLGADKKVIRSVVLQDVNDYFANNNLNYSIRFQADYIDGFVCLNNFVYLQSNLQTQNDFKLNISSQFMQSFIFSLNTDIQENMTVSASFLVGCERGYLLDANKLTCEPCPFGTYSNQENIVDLALECKICSYNDNFNCYGGSKISPKRGYYRYSPGTNKILKCLRGSACLGDLIYESKVKNGILEGSVKILRSLIDNTKELSSFIGMCAKGFRGVLCAECEEKYGQVEGYGCADCDGWLEYFKQFVIFFIKVFLFLLEIHRVFKFGETLKEKKGVIDESAKIQAQSSYCLKIFKDHFSVLMLLALFPLSFPEEFSSFLAVITTPTSPEIQRVFTFDCLLKRTWPDSRLASTQISLFIILFFDLGVTLLYFAYYYFKISKRNAPFIKDFTGTCSKLFMYIILMNIIGQVQPFLMQFFCFEVSDSGATGIKDIRLMKDLQISCSDPTQIAIQYGLCLPIVIVFGVLLPFGFSISNLIKFFKGRLFLPEELEKYGYFYIQYKPAYFFYDFIVYLKRIFIVFLQVLIVFALVLGEILLVNVLFVILTYCIAVFLNYQYIRPYREHLKELQNLEKFSALSLSMTTASIIVWVAQTSEFNLGLACFLLALVFIFNFVFVFWVFKVFFATKKTQFMAFRRFSTGIKLKIKEMMRRNSNLTEYPIETMAKEATTIQEKLTESQKEIKKLKALICLMSKQIRALQSTQIIETNVPDEEKNTNTKYFSTNEDTAPDVVLLKKEANLTPKPSLYNPNRFLFKNEDLEEPASNREILSHARVELKSGSVKKQKDDFKKGSIQTERLGSASGLEIKDLIWKCEGESLKSYYFSFIFQIAALPNEFFDLKELYFLFFNEKESFIKVKREVTRNKDGTISCEIWMRPLTPSLNHDLTLMVAKMKGNVMQKYIKIPIAIHNKFRLD